MIFPVEYFEKLIKSPNVSPKVVETIKGYHEFLNYDDYKQCLHTLNDLEIKYLADIIIHREIDTQTVREEKYKFESVEKIFASVNSHNRHINDFRSQLWIPLPIRDKLKLFLNQTDTHESKLMTMLM